jgi:hypothetical protein
LKKYHAKSIKDWFGFLEPLFQRVIQAADQKVKGHTREPIKVGKKNSLTEICVPGARG